MRIFVVGNINAGKSFLVKHLRCIFPMYKTISIDDYRVEYGDGTLEKELKIREIFAEDIINNKDAIIEFSGGDTITSLFMSRLRNNSALVIEVQEEINTCIERIRQKDFSKIPYPKFNEEIADTIKRLNHDYENNIIDLNFKDKILRKYRFNTQKDDIYNIPLKQYESAIQIADLFEGKYKNLFLFGSMANGNLNHNSDIDLFLKTSDSVNMVKRELSKIYPKSRYIIQRNQIAIFDDESLVEINVIKDINQAKKFYNTSKVKDVKKTILLGDESLEKDLNQIISTYNFDIAEEFTYVLERLKYYSTSLNRIIAMNDIYKYYFYCNIILHESIKLSHYMNGNKDYCYLPKESDKYLRSNELENILYKYGDCMETHHNNVNKIIDKILLESESYLYNLKKEILNESV